MWVEKTSKGHFKFVESYKDPYTGKTKRVSKTYAKNTPAVRKKALQDLNKKINARIHKIDSYTFNEALRVYFDSIEMKHTTMHTKRVAFNSLLKYFDDGNMFVDKITPAYIRDIYSRGEVSRGYMVILKAFFNWCYKNDYVSSKIFDKIELKSQNHRPSYEKLYFEPEELQEIFSKLDGNKYTVYSTRLLLEFLTLTGLRIGEALALTHDDIHDYKLEVTKNYTDFKLTTPKSEASIRTIGINFRCVQIANEMKLLKRINGINSNIVFPNTLGKHQYYTSVRKVLEKHGIYPTRLHIYRHTHASLLADKGLPLDMIQRRLGHEDDGITKQIYIHITEKKKQREYEVFKNLDIL